MLSRRRRSTWLCLVTVFVTVCYLAFRQQEVDSLGTGSGSVHDGRRAGEEIMESLQRSRRTPSSSHSGQRHGPPQHGDNTEHSVKDVMTEQHRPNHDDQHYEEDDNEDDLDGPLGTEAEEDDGQENEMNEGEEPDMDKEPDDTVRDEGEEGRQGEDGVLSARKGQEGKGEGQMKDVAEQEMNYENRRMGTAQSSDSQTVLETDTHKAHLVIVAYMRTGSSMTGRILQSSPDVFYWYEPLHSLERYYVTGGNPQSPYRNKTLNELFKASDMAGGNVSATLSCDIRHVYNLTLLDHFMTYGTYGTRHFHPCFSRAASEHSAALWQQCALNMTNVCRSKFKATAVKSIRLHMARAIEVMQRDPKVKVVHLIRDPRGVLLSRRKLGFANFKKLDSEAALLCGKYNEDLRYIPEPYNPLRARYKLVRYEDIAANPLTHTQQLFKLMGLAPSTDVLKAVKDMMKSAKHSKPCPTCPPVPLNSTEVSQAWRQSMSWQEVQTISKECVEVMEQLGYKVSFRSEAELRDLRVSAVGPMEYL